MHRGPLQWPQVSSSSLVACLHWNSIIRGFFWLQHLPRMGSPLPLIVPAWTKLHTHWGCIVVACQWGENLRWQVKSLELMAHLKKLLIFTDYLTGLGKEWYKPCMTNGHVCVSKMHLWCQRYLMHLVQLSNIQGSLAVFWSPWDAEIESQFPFLHPDFGIYFVPRF